MDNEHGASRQFRHRCVAEVAARQWGNIGIAQLHDCGVTADSVKRWAADGRIHRVHRGVYAVGHRSPAPEAAWAAALLACGEGAVLSHRAAAAVHGLLPPPDTVDVTTPGRIRPHRGVRTHSPSMPLRRDEVTRAKGLNATTVPRTLLDLAADGMNPKRLIAEAVARRLTSMPALRAYLASRPGARGSARLRIGIDGRQARSGLEDRFASFLRRFGLPEPVMNEKVGPFTVDGIWPEAGLVVEIDTIGTHGTAWSFENDRLRDAYLVGRGLRVIRVTERRIEQDDRRLAADIRRALAHR